MYDAEEYQTEANRVQGQNHVLDRNRPKELKEFAVQGRETDEWLSMLVIKTLAPIETLHRPQDDTITVKTTEHHRNRTEAMHRARHVPAVHLQPKPIENHLQQRALKK